MSNKINLRTKLLFAFLAVGLIPLTVVGITTLTKASLSIEKQAFAQLESVRDIKKSQIIRYFQTVKDQVITFSEDKMIIEAMRQFDRAFDDFNAENTITSEDLTSMQKALFGYYANDFSQAYKSQNNGSAPKIEKIFRQLDTDFVLRRPSIYKRV